MINVLESQLTIAAVLLDLYTGVKDRADKQLISKNEMGAHLVNIQNILRKLSAAINDSKKYKKDHDPIPAEMKSELEAIDDAFNETFEDFQEYYDKIPDGFEPVAESFKKNIPDDINWIAYNNHQGEA